MSFQNFYFDFLDITNCFSLDCHQWQLNTLLRVEFSKNKNQHQYRNPHKYIVHDLICKFQFFKNIYSEIDFSKKEVSMPVFLTSAAIFYDFSLTIKQFLTLISPEKNIDNIFNDIVLESLVVPKQFEKCFGINNELFYKLFTESKDLNFKNNSHFSKTNKTSLDFLIKIRNRLFHPNDVLSEFNNNNQSNSFIYDGALMELMSKDFHVEVNKENYFLFLPDFSATQFSFSFFAVKKDIFLNANQKIKEFILKNNFLINEIKVFLDDYKISRLPDFQEKNWNEITSDELLNCSHEYLRPFRYRFLWILFNYLKKIEKESFSTNERNLSSVDYENLKKLFLMMFNASEKLRIWKNDVYELNFDFYNKLINNNKELQHIKQQTKNELSTEFLLDQFFKLTPFDETNDLSIFISQVLANDPKKAIEKFQTEYDAIMNYSNTETFWKQVKFL